MFGATEANSDSHSLLVDRVEHNALFRRIPLLTFHLASVGFRKEASRKVPQSMVDASLELYPIPYLTLYVRAAPLGCDAGRKKDSFLPLKNSQ